MPYLFKLPVNKSLNQKILILIKPNSIPNRLFSSKPIKSHLSRKEHEAKRIAMLKKLGLSNMDLIWPKTNIGNVNYIEQSPQSTEQMYAEADLSKVPIFQGGFINFGYWPNPLFQGNEITKEQRTAASKEMYRVIANLANILEGHNVLEVGAGLGYGSSFISQQYDPKLVIGIDISPEQIARAKRYQVSGVKSGKLRFTIGEAEVMPFTEASFDSVISVEAAQHFDSMTSFSKEVTRVLKPGGKLVVTSFFPTIKEGVDVLNAIVPEYHIHGSQHTVDEMKNELAKYMDSVKVTSIGKNVWHGFSRWLDQIGYEQQWSKIWSTLYDKGLLDYVVYEATAPKLKTELITGNKNRAVKL